MPDCAWLSSPGGRAAGLHRGVKGSSTKGREWSEQPELAPRRAGGLAGVSRRAASLGCRADHTSSLGKDRQCKYCGKIHQQLPFSKQNKVSECPPNTGLKKWRQKSSPPTSEHGMKTEAHFAPLCFSVVQMNGKSE